MNIHAIDTPALIVDLDVMERNIRRHQDRLDQCGIKNRPHIKTHKIPELAHKQLAAGAIGIACQKLGEAEVMADNGVSDILITYNIVGEKKLERLVRLAKRTDLIVTVDDLSVAQGISDAATKEGLRIGVLVELGSEIERTGVPTPAALVELAVRVDRLEGLGLRGMMIFPSGPKDAGRIEKAIAGLRSAGLSTEIISGGGTPAATQLDRVPGITEHRAGTYIFNDKHTVDKGAAGPDDCALTVLTTVVSHPTPNRAIIDAGSKAFSSDGEAPMGYFPENPPLQLYRMYEEHGLVDTSETDKAVVLGDRLRVIPNHVCPAVNLFDELFGIREGRVEVRWDIQARGKLA